MSPALPWSDPAAALASIREAARRIEPYARRTPTVYSYTFSESTGADVWLKLENLQRTGSFKLRGALNHLLRMDPAVRARGVLAASAGNHAQGLALAAQLLEAPATIVMPLRTALVKVQRTEGYGAEVVLHGESYDEAQLHASQLARERGASLVHPFDDPDIVAGQGTVGLEVLDEVADLEAVFVPVGGGGLVSGLALAVKALRPEVRVIGVQAAGAAPMVASVRAGARRVVERPRTLAEGIRVGTTGELTFEVARRFVDEWVEVGEDAILEAVVQTMEKSKVVPEAAGVAGIAALISEGARGAARVCAVVSGGNIDLNLLGRIIESGLERSGRTHLLAVRMRDRPGELARVLEVTSGSEANVLDVQHYRAGWKVPLGSVDVEILLELRHARAGREIERTLRERGFDVRS